MHNFPSKKDLWLGVLIWGSLGASLIASIFSTSLTLVIFTIILAVFISWLWFDTNYRLTEKELVIKSGPFIKVIPLLHIQGVKRSKSPLASPALSLDRLEIRYKGGLTFISPQNSEEFLRLLQEKTDVPKS